MFLRTAALTTLVTMLLTAGIYAQGAVPSAPSSAFNWLNLNRNGNSAAANYYQLVRPNFQTQNALMNVQQQYSNLTQSVTNMNDPNAFAGIRDTRHAATYMNYGHYYPKVGGGAAAGGGGRPGPGGQRR